MKLQTTNLTNAEKAIAEMKVDMGIPAHTSHLVQVDLWHHGKPGPSRRSLSWVVSVFRDDREVVQGHGDTFAHALNNCRAKLQPEAITLTPKDKVIVEVEED